MKPKPTFLLRRLVEIDWVDSQARGRWDSEEEYRKTDVGICRSAGYLLKRDARVITIIQSQSDRGGLSDSMTIPMVAVRRVRRLK